ncbi:hypothetical protein KC349_g8502 [Hortaea werneckii]|nr:hypothetical protein KC349_g8502 [Hortaea werneckii]
MQNHLPDRDPGATMQSAAARGVHETAMSPRPGPIRTNGVGRKPRACVACKQLKMRCEVPEGSTKCSRCRKRGLQCELGRSMATYSIPPADYGQKIDTMCKAIGQLQQTVDRLIQQSNLSSGDAPREASPIGNSPASAASNQVHTQRSLDFTRMAMTRDNSPEPPHQSEPTHTSVVVTEPMGSLYELTRLRNLRSNQSKLARRTGELEAGNDFISRGLLDNAEAEELFDYFLKTLNQYLWIGLEELHPTLDSVRKSSSLLTATIMTVTALHRPTSVATFDNCYTEFLASVSSSMFDRYHSVDDVRGLCIAAFWLSDVSWKLCGHAIRIATELSIHQSFFRALDGDREHFLRARLWYMLYVCDHHFSIAYGRPPTISESVQIREHERLLQIPLAGPLDMRILSQVSLFQILTRVHERFAEQRLPHQPGHGLLSESSFPDLRQFNLEIDQWRIHWQVRQVHNAYIGAFPPMGNVLYSYFAKLQINAFAVRGVNTNQGSLSTERKEFANIAVSAATSILTYILDEPDLRRCLVGTPLYVHTMIAFASVFLMKMGPRGRAMGVQLDMEFVWSLIARMVHLLQSSVTSNRHLLYYIAAGLDKMLTRLKETTASTASNDLHMSPYDQSSTDQAFDLNGGPSYRADWQQYLPPIHDSALLDQNLINANHICEAFGGESAGGVYNLLANQFSHLDGMNF